MAAYWPGLQIAARFGCVFQVGVQGDDALPGRMDQRAGIAVDRQHRVAQAGEESGMAAGAAGQVEHLASRRQRRPALDPARGQTDRVLAHR
jgi:hypothetical protein